MFQGVFLSLQKISQKRACTDCGTLIILKSQSFQSTHMKMLFQCSYAQIIIKIPALQRIQGNIQPVLDLIQVHAAHAERFITDDFRRRELVYLVQKGSDLIHFRHHKITGGHIRDSYAEPVGEIDNCHNIVIFCLVKSLGV